MQNSTTTDGVGSFSDKFVMFKPLRVWLYSIIKLRNISLARAGACQSVRRYKQKGIRSRKRALYMWQEFRLTHKTERNAHKE